jgi:hypothetical protein
MSGTHKKHYSSKDAAELQTFIGNVTNSEGKSGLVLDSASAADAAMDSMKNESGATPGALSELLGMAANPEEETKLVKAVYDGVNAFTREHGFAPTGDLLLAAIHQSRTVFDSVNNSHHDQISVFPNAPIVAIMGAMAEATPFAGYLPADRGSNEARLIIVNHIAGSTWSDYKQNDIMDGVAAGGGYLGSSRTLELAAPNASTAFTFAFKAGADGAGAALNLLRGRAIVYVNGIQAVTEISNGSSALATVPVSGVITMASVEYVLTGTVKPATGEVSVTPVPALPAGTMVTCEVFVDYEADPSVTPRMAVQALSYSLFANPFRANYLISPEARSQFANEVGVDAGAEAMLAVRGQYAQERHYNALKKAKMVGKYNSPFNYDFGFASQIQQKTRAQIWQDFSSVVGAASQKMAEDTADHGITHMYVGRNVAAQFLSMPRELFEPSGIVARPGIYRLGRLFGLYEVYYTPKVVVEAPDGSTSEIVCIGRSTQTARCPVIFGDASAPVFEQLGMGENQKSGYGFNARSFTALNPHAMSAKGCALITIVNLK